MEDSSKHDVAAKAVGAMLGAAYGDALGWPNERPGQSQRSSRQSELPLRQLVAWTRRSGGRFYPHEEAIEAGEYSDDTQLILCISRSLLRGKQWWEHWTHVELPFWTLYERGGGGATKRAANAWVVGNAPWTPSPNDEDVRRYFDAGGNGVAMRVLPHSIWGADSSCFAPVYERILLDGIATHGHPRALVGALAYGHALWSSVKRTSRLPFGAIVEETLAAKDQWSAMPLALPTLPAGWVSAAQQLRQSYEKAWQDAVSETEQFLLQCRNALGKGALTVDDDVLRDLRCFDRQVNGAGTVAAATAIYLASRYAADPTRGVVTAAHAKGSDTDTIASMTGGLLGTVCGPEWFANHRPQLQDSAYIAQVARQVLSREPVGRSTLDVKKADLQRWREDITEIPAGDHLALPDGRSATVAHQDVQIGRSGSYRVEFRKLLCDDGQTLHISKIVKGSFRDGPHPRIPQALVPQPGERACGPKLRVSSIDASTAFYQGVLGLTIKKRHEGAVVFDQGLVLVPADYAAELLPDGRPRCLLYVQVSDIEGRFERVKGSGASIVTPLGIWGHSKMHFFRCLDSDGNLVEVFAERG